jgi:hypothetical protein
MTKSGSRRPSEGTWWLAVRIVALGHQLWEMRVVHLARLGTESEGSKCALGPRLADGPKIDYALDLFALERLEKALCPSVHRREDQ